MLPIILGNVVLGIGILINVITMQQKDKKNILIGLILVNLTSTIAYIFLGTYSASVVTTIAIFQTYIKYKYDQKDKKMPIYLQIIFIIISIIGGIFTAHSWLDIIPTICLVLYTLSILQSKERNIRLLIVANILGWIIYDAYALAFVGILTSMFSLTSTIIAIIRYDIRKEAKKENEN